MAFVLLSRAGENFDRAVAGGAVNRLIHFICVESTHPPNGDGYAKFHERVWAWCPSRETTGHRWQRLAEPTTLANVLEEFRKR
jgi:hypothetical protein